jgi:hypothetical protein
MVVQQIRSQHEAKVLVQIRPRDGSRLAIQRHRGNEKCGQVRDGGKRTGYVWQGPSSACSIELTVNEGLTFTELRALWMGHLLDCWVVTLLIARAVVFIGERRIIIVRVFSILISM